MRPVNLIPPEDRRGQHAPLRTGPLAYIVVGALVAAPAGRHGAGPHRQPDLRQQERGRQAEARRRGGEAREPQRLAAYTQFRDLREQRVATVTSLADSRFDWERVMRELALVLPERRLAGRT